MSNLSKKINNIFEAYDRSELADLKRASLILSNIYNTSENAFMVKILKRVMMDLNTIQTRLETSQIATQGNDKEWLSKYNKEGRFPEDLRGK